jgi:hypothetical protein
VTCFSCVQRQLAGVTREAYDRDVAIDLGTNVVIARPRDEVAAYAVEPYSATAWHGKVSAAEWRTPKSPAVERSE